MHRHGEHRAALSGITRVVIKFGTRVLVDARGRPNPDRFAAIVAQIATLRKAGREVVLVSSGAVGAGLDALGFTKRPTDISELQMAASVGQSRLMTMYSQLFAEYGLTVGQVLLNHDDLKNRTRHLNARNTLMALLKNGVVPVVNENDVTSIDEIRVGDNDSLAAMVTILVDAKALILCTSVNGLRAPDGDSRTRRVPYLPKLTQDALDLVFGKGSELSTGGMATKLEAAQMVSRAGALAVIADGRKKDTLLRVLAGDDVGTLLGPVDELQRVRNKRKHWIAFFHRASGTLVVDEGARQALLFRGKSLLAAGIVDVIGHFATGSLLHIRDEAGQVLGSGLTEFNSDDLNQIQGRSSEAIEELLGPARSREVIHRDNLAPVERPENTELE